MEWIDGGVTAPKGFLATGGKAGIKSGEKKDLALLFSETPAVCAAAFTTNVVKAASVLRNMEIVEKGNLISGIAINSGNANACTGEAGVASNIRMAEAFAKAKNVKAEAILTASTGVIGAPFPIEKIEKGIAAIAPQLGNNREDAILAAQSIMTTDTRRKEIALKVTLAGTEVKIGGMAKGSGMIHPNMATMLSFITTDAAIAPELLDAFLKKDIQTTYNMVSVDGDTSTNDTVVILANGCAGNPVIMEENEEYLILTEALHAVNEWLAKHLVKDGEGATKLIEVQVRGAANDADAKTIAKSVIRSSLLKAAMFGEDANWGRVLCAMGYSGANFDSSRVSMDYQSGKGKIALMDMGAPIVFDEVLAREILAEEEIQVLIDLHTAEGSAIAWGCDLTYDYVKINGDYRS